MDRLIIVDDHPLFSEALTHVVNDLYPGATTDTCTSLAPAIRILRSMSSVDLVLLDIHIPGESGLSGLLHLRQLFPMLAVAMISAEDDPRIINESLALGAVGFIPKSLSSKHLRQALKQIAAGQPFIPQSLQRHAFDDGHALSHETLTRKQLQVWHLMSEGASNKAIAGKLFIAESTVKAHVTEILRKLGVSSRVEAIVLAQKKRTPEGPP